MGPQRALRLVECVSTKDLGAITVHVNWDMWQMDPIALVW